MGFDTIGQGPLNPKQIFGTQGSYQDTTNNVVEIFTQDHVPQALQSAIMVANQDQLPALVPDGTDQTLFTANLNAGFLGKLSRVIRVRVWLTYGEGFGGGDAFIAKLKYGSTVLGIISAGDVLIGIGGDAGIPGYIEFEVLVGVVSTSNTVNLVTLGRADISNDADNTQGPAVVILSPATSSNGVTTASMEALTVTFSTSTNAATTVQGTLATIEVVN